MPIQRITSRVIEDGIIAAADIADGSITTAKIADANVTTDKIVSVANTKITGNIISSQITSVSNTQITGLINTAQIANAAITTALIANNSIITEDIVDRAITDVKIANTAVTAGVYGGSSNSALITVDAQGRITSASNVAASGYSGLQAFQVFNTPGTFTLPPGITSVKVTVIGGGGGGGTLIAPEVPGGGYGGGGGAGIKLITGLTGPVAVSVGSGGNSPGAGGTSSFGPFLSATGGNAGNPAHPHGSPSGNPGTPGSSPLGTINSFALSGYISPSAPYITGYLTAGQGGNGGGGLGSSGRVIVEF